MPGISKICTKVSQRWLTVFLGLFGFLNVYAMRVCLSIAITEMALPPNNTKKIFSDDTCTDKHDDEARNDTHTSEPKRNFNHNKYDWSEQMQGAILSSFYCGYIFGNIFAGAIIRRLGGKHTLGSTVLCASALTLLTPLCTAWGGSTALIVLRVALGLASGPAFGAVSDLLAKWIPADERSKAALLAFSALPIGILFGNLASGIILEHSAIGWPAVFYFYGGVGLVSFLLNTAFCYSRPADSPFISDAELDYLRDKLKNTEGNKRAVSGTPWRRIFKSPAVWSLLVHTSGLAWGQVMIVSDIPKYMSNVLKLSSQDNGLLLSVPQLCALLFGLVVSWLVDKLIAARKLSNTRARKILGATAALGLAAFLLAASYAGCDAVLVVVAQSVGTSLMDCMLFGALVNAIDLSPNHAGTINGLLSGIATAASVLLPYFVGLITPNGTMSEWRAAFWMVSAVLAVTCLPFLVYGSGDVQDWNDPNFADEAKSEAKDGLDLLPDKAQCQVAA